MLSGGRDATPKSNQVKEKDKNFSRALSKEISKVEPSFRVLYYGGASGAVPFMWESRPGTPKHTFSDSSLPPLTPPPSYQFKGNSNCMQKDFKHNFLGNIFPRMGSMSNKTHISPSFSSSSVSSSGSSSYSLPSTPLKLFVRRSCSDVRSRSAIWSKSRWEMKKVKKALWSVLGHGCKA